MLQAEINRHYVPAENALCAAMAIAPERLRGVIPSFDTVILRSSLFGGAP